MSQTLNTDFTALYPAGGRSPAPTAGSWSSILFDPRAHVALFLSRSQHPGPPAVALRAPTTAGLCSEQGRLTRQIKLKQGQSTSSGLSGGWAGGSIRNISGPLKTQLLAPPSDLELDLGGRTPNRGPRGSWWAFPVASRLSHSQSSCEREETAVRPRAWKAREPTGLADPTAETPAGSFLCPHFS